MRIQDNSMSGLLAGKVILITGAASGIGLATARLAVLEGASVLLADHDRRAGEEALASMRDAGPRVAFACTDVTSDQQINVAVAAALKAFGSLDGAFNNAGISTSPAVPAGEKAADTDDAAWQRVFDVNVTGVWRCMRAEIRQMLEAGKGGSIVNNASIGGLVGIRGHAAYSASKHAVVGLSKSAALDYARTGIRINAICPGVTATKINEHLMGDVAQKAVASIPVRRFGKSEEIAEAVVWLLSDRASFVTGSAMTADGGYTAV